MTAVTRATDMIEAVIGRILTNEELIRIGNRVWQSGIHGHRMAIIIDNPTNEEIAEFILEDTLGYWQSRIRQAVHEDEQATIEAAQAVALTDLD